MIINVKIKLYFIIILRVDAVHYVSEYLLSTLFSFVLFV